MSYNVAQIDALAGRDEDELAMARTALHSLAGGGASMITAQSAAAIKWQSRVTLDEEQGDYLAATGDNQQTLDEADYENSHFSAFYEKAADLALAHDVGNARAALGNGSDAKLEEQAAVGYGWDLCNLVPPQFAVLAAISDWRAVRVHLERLLQLPVMRAVFTRASNRTQMLPWLALAKAETGDTKAALVEIGRSPPDCYLCLRLRGRIDALKGNPAGADFWFARAVAAAPSLPFAYTEWGAALLARRDAEGAIAKFETAHAKGPHFADPLEMWGEALMQENRSDLALAKFEEADKYAPNWGRLHLEWGKAFAYAGKPAEAKKQLTTAASLDLSQADKAALATWRKTHG